MLTTLEPKALDPEEVNQMKEHAVVWKETTVPKASLYADHTLKTKHTVGQIVHNVHKIYRVLEKSNYMSRVQKRGEAANNALQQKLEEGDPQTYGAILKYLAFESSTAFINYLRANEVNMQIQYMVENKFLREFTKVMIDLFKYRVALSPEQFIQRGYTERKMVLVLDLYDLVKQVRKMAKIGYKINMKDTTWQHPCDQPFKQYQVIDHSRGISKQMQFNMNACLLKTNITCQ